jgi:hypothetical protein
VLVATAALVAVGEVFVPDEGIAWLAVRLLLVLALPFVLLLTGFFSAEERGWLLMLTKPGELKAKLLEARRVGKAAGEEGEGTDAEGRPQKRGLPEAIEVEQWDEDLRS